MSPAADTPAQRRWPPSPHQVVSLALGALGVWLVVLNRVAPDESRTLGVLLALAGLALLVSRETERRRRVLEMLCVLVLLLAGGEWAARWQNRVAQQNYAERLVRFVDDPELRYVMQPHRENGAGRTNSRGMLDVEREEPHPPGLVRVACLGDSVGGDFQLPNDNACAALERRLGAARGGRPTEVLNFSVPGYNTMQEARMLETRAVPFAPDAIVVLYVINDPFPDLAISSYLPGHLKFEHMLSEAVRVPVARLLGRPDDRWGGALHAMYEEPTAWDAVVVRGFDRIQHVARARGLPVVVAVWPLFMERYGEPYYGIYQRVVDEASRHGFVPLNLRTAAFQGVPFDQLLKPSRDLIHPNARAHGLAADAIAQALVAARPELVTR